MAELTLKVSQLTDIIKSYLEDQVGVVTVEGEISNYKPHYSGHRYFTLKDEGAQISCVMWKSRPLNFSPSEGMNVVVKGNLSVYAPRGSYQLDIYSMTPKGIGDLYLAYEQMKAKLEQKGYFAMERKRELPRMPIKIGVSTSPTGAAVQDIFSTLKRRFPYAEIYFRPTIVQGESATADIVKAIKELNQTEAEVLIIGRGGGSIEDLWAYNTEEVANAIFNSNIPVISAVGHETDFTIADFVADRRAATPTAAAELATPLMQSDIISFLDNSQIRMSRNITKSVNQKYQKLDELWQSGIERKVNDKIKRFKDNLNREIKILNQSMLRIIDDRKQALEFKTELLKKSNPSMPLDKGYAMLKHNGHLIGLNEKLSNYKIIDIIRKDETIKAKIEQPKNQNMEELF
ncbi:MAG: exodeoxyribonuclease VII large subunit [Candidatus Kapaibacteriota bacterium]